MFIKKIGKFSPLVLSLTVSRCRVAYKDEKDEVRGLKNSILSFFGYL